MLQLTCWFRSRCIVHVGLHEKAIFHQILHVVQFKSVWCFSRLTGGFVVIHCWYNIKNCLFIAKYEVKRQTVWYRQQKPCRYRVHIGCFGPLHLFHSDCTLSTPYCPSFCNAIRRLRKSTVMSYLRAPKDIAWPPEWSALGLLEVILATLKRPPLRSNCFSDVRPRLAAVAAGHWNTSERPERRGAPGVAAPGPRPASQRYPRMMPPFNGPYTTGVISLIRVVGRLSTCNIIVRGDVARQARRNDFYFHYV